jgi:glycosyltransferase involved in cell wall biosynthesis
MRLVYVGTSSLSLRLLKGQLRFFRRAGFEVMVIASPGEEFEFAQQRESVQTIAVPIARGISPWRDFKSFWQLLWTIRALQPAITDVGTPKAGLLGGLAAFLNRVPCRIYTLRGLRMETSSGWERRILIFAERLACLAAQRVICVSESLRRQAVSLRIVDEKRTVVLGAGSSHGVDVNEFAPAPKTLPATLQLREELGIPLDAPVVGFVGRFTRDKGVADLVEAFDRLCHRFSSLRLLLVGGFEEGDNLPERIRQRICGDPNIISAGFVKETSLYYHLMNLLALPTYREGFPNAVLEAHASGKPVVVTNATGAVDSVIDGVTGLMVPVGDVTALADAIALLIDNPSQAAAMGMAGRERVLREFRQEIVVSALLSEYTKLLSSKGLVLNTIQSVPNTPGT